MSRGIGKMQREAILALWDHEEGVAGGMPLAELKRSISADRSNSRRAIRGLIERGFAVEVTGEEGERRVALTGGAHMALWLATEYKDETLNLERVPGRPLNFDAGDDLGIVEDDRVFLDTLLSLELPHESSPPPEPARKRQRGARFRAWTCHANGDNPCQCAASPGSWRKRQRAAHA